MTKSSPVYTVISDAMPTEPPTTNGPWRRFDNEQAARLSYESAIASGRWWHVHLWRGQEQIASYLNGIRRENGRVDGS